MNRRAFLSAFAASIPASATTIDTPQFSGNVPVALSPVAALHDYVMPCIIYAGDTRYWAAGGEVDARVEIWLDAIKDGKAHWRRVVRYTPQGRQMTAWFRDGDSFKPESIPNPYEREPVTRTQTLVTGVERLDEDVAISGERYAWEVVK